MSRDQDFRHILRLARIYRRIFSVLICSIGLADIKEGNKNNDLIARKCPVILFVLFASAIAAMVLVFQSNLTSAYSLTENVALFVLVFSHFVTFIFPLIQSMFNYRKIYFFWCKIYETSCFALNELGYEISFGYFWKRFFTDTAISVGIFTSYGLVAVIFPATKMPVASQFCVIVLQEIIIYVVVHALFIVNLNSFFIRLLIKYIGIDYRSRTSNLIFDHRERSLLYQLRLYKKFHYKLWEMTTAVNGFFGLTLLLMSYHAFIDIAYAAYHIFLYMARHDPASILISNILFCITHYHIIINHF